MADLLPLKWKLEKSIQQTKLTITRAAESGNYVAALELANQNIGKRFALTLIEEELENDDRTGS